MEQQTAAKTISDLGFTFHCVADNAHFSLTELKEIIGQNDLDLDGAHTGNIKRMVEEVTKGLISAMETSKKAVQYIKDNQLFEPQGL